MNPIEALRRFLPDKSATPCVDVILAPVGDAPFWTRIFRLSLIERAVSKTINLKLRGSTS